MDSTDRQDQLLQIWMDVLLDVDDGAVQIAAREYLLGTDRFMPPPGVIRERARTLMGTSPTAKAIAEWEHYLAYLDGREPLDFEKHKLAIEVKESVGVDGLLDDDMKQMARDKFIAEYIRVAKDADALALGAGATLKLMGAK